MSKIASVVTLLALTTSTAVFSQDAVSNLRGTWKGESETIILGGGNAHHTAPASPTPD